VRLVVLLAVPSLHTTLIAQLTTGLDTARLTEHRETHRERQAEGVRQKETKNNANSSFSWEPRIPGTHPANESKGDVKVGDEETEAATGDTCRTAMS
jgi:hypothetical protein